MLFVLDWCYKVTYWYCYSFCWFIGLQVNFTKVQDEMMRTAPYRWFYVIVHSCCFCTWKGFNRHITNYSQSFVYLPSIKVFYHIVSYDKYSFFVLFSYWFIIFVMNCCNCSLCVTTPIQGSYHYHVLVDLFRWIFLWFILLTFFLFIAEASWSVFILDLVAVDSFCVLYLFVISLVFRSYWCCCLFWKKHTIISGKIFSEGVYNFIFGF